MNIDKGDLAILGGLGLGFGVGFIFFLNSSERFWVSVMAGLAIGGLTKAVFFGKRKQPPNDAE